MPDHSVLSLVRTATTRWGNQYLQVARNCTLRPAIDRAVDVFKRNNKGNQEAIVEPNESDQGSKAGKPVPAAELGLSTEDWDLSTQLEAFLEYPYETKEAIEHKGYCTGAQATILLHDVMSTHCDVKQPLRVKPLPSSLKVSDRERPPVRAEASTLDYSIDLARKELGSQLRSRIFDKRPSNARCVQLYMCKQLEAKAILTES